ncbi:MAG TPA: ferritin-like domain-containing protein [Rhizomicrobium sp.]|nr:ferritin-like domain-containing protein [Rhizomicrobium sp.]
MAQITKDLAYDAADPRDFPAMLEAERYGRRSAAFDRIISATHDHFWDPLDPKYIDFREPFDPDAEMVLPEDFFVIFRTRVGDRMSRDQKIRFASQAARWQLSSILHGEQGALALSASLCHILKDPGAQEYAANQTREEARHVTAFSKYIQARWEKPLPCGPTLQTLLTELVLAPEVYKKIVGMQMLVEGLAMGAFATLYQLSNDPLLVKLCQLVMTDEAFHHKFGKIWADRTIPKLSEDEHNSVEDWAAQCFQTLLFNLVNPEQMQVVYSSVGIDWHEARDAIMEAFTDEDRREQMKRSSNIFRVLVKTLLNAGIVTERTKPFYAMYIDMDELKREGDRMVGDDIAEDGIRFLRSLNFGANKPRFAQLAAE